MRRLTIAITLIALFSGLAAGPANGANKKAIWGPTTMPGGGSAFPTYQALGVDVFQLQLHWDAVAPTPPADPSNPFDPAYRWPAALDAALPQAAAHGIEVALLVQRAPAWANGGASPITAPNRPADYASFLRAASARYPSVRKWMIWGEVNRALSFQPGGRKGARKYGRLLNAAFDGLNRANRENIVIGANTVNAGEITPPKFIRAMKRKGKMPKMDLWGHNPFDDRRPRLKDKPIRKFRGLNDVDTLWKEIEEAYEGQRKKGRPKGLFLSEWTLPTDHPAPVFGTGFFVSREEQAERISAAYRMVNRLKYVKALGYFTLLDQPPGPLSNAWGLMTYTGAPKPGYYAYAAAR